MDLTIRLSGECTAVHDLAHSFATQAAAAGISFTMQPSVTQTIRQLPIEKLNLNIRAHNILKREEIHTVGQLLACTEDVIRNFRNMTKLPLDNIKQALRPLGLELRTASYEPLKTNSNFLGRPIEELNLSAETALTLGANGIATIGGLLERISQLGTLEGATPNQLREIVATLKHNGLVA